MPTLIRLNARRGLNRTFRWVQVYTRDGRVFVCCLFSIKRCNVFCAADASRRRTCNLQSHSHAGALALIHLAATAATMRETFSDIAPLHRNTPRLHSRVRRVCRRKHSRLLLVASCNVVVVVVFIPLRHTATIAASARSVSVSTTQRSSLL